MCLKSDSVTFCRVTSWHEGVIARVAAAGLLPDDRAGCSWLAPWQTDSGGNCRKRAPATTDLGRLMAHCRRLLLLPHVNRRIEAFFFVATTTPLPAKPANGRWKSSRAVRRHPASSARWLIGQSLRRHRRANSANRRTGSLGYQTNLPDALILHARSPRWTTRRDMQVLVIRKSGPTNFSLHNCWKAFF
jgi:hypothetical protein